MGSEVPPLGQFGRATSHPINNSVKGEGHRFNRFCQQTETVGQCPQRIIVPLAEMMRRSIQHEIRNISYRRLPAPHNDAETSAGSGACCEVACEAERIDEMLDVMEGIDHVVFFG